jgi:flagellar assembly protein FliH
MLISRKIILREARTDATILRDVVKAALANISERDEIIVHLNPDDYTMVISRKDFFPEELMTERMRLKPDPTLHQGSCNVNTEMGTIDADFDSQLEEIYRHLLEERNSSSGDAPA